MCAGSWQVGREGGEGGRRCGGGDGRGGQDSRKRRCTIAVAEKPLFSTRPGRPAATPATKKKINAARLIATSGSKRSASERIARHSVVHGLATSVFQYVR